MYLKIAIFFTILHLATPIPASPPKPAAAPHATPQAVIAPPPTNPQVKPRRPAGDSKQGAIVQLGPHTYLIDDKGVARNFPSVPVAIKQVYIGNGKWSKVSKPGTIQQGPFIVTPVDLVKDAAYIDQLNNTFKTLNISLDLKEKEVLKEIAQSILVANEGLQYVGSAVYPSIAANIQKMSEDLKVLVHDVSKNTAKSFTDFGEFNRGINNLISSLILGLRSGFQSISEDLNTLARNSVSAVAENIGHKIDKSIRNVERHAVRAIEKLQKRRRVLY